MGCLHYAEQQLHVCEKPLFPTVKGSDSDSGGFAKSDHGGCFEKVSAQHFQDKTQGIRRIRNKRRGQKGVRVPTGTALTALYRYGSGYRLPILEFHQIAFIRSKEIHRRFSMAERTDTVCMVECMFLLQKPEKI